MVLSSSACDTLIPSKRPAPSDCESYRLSRSMTADDPHGRNLLLNAQSLPVPSSTRRRVNPESLAIRLGPELVAELDRYVLPGVVEMPSFAIRQEIQMRFNVDRRHIYDWFHSKGLRVTKEDKRATVEQKTDAMRTQRRMRRSVVPVLPYPGARLRLSKGEGTSPRSSPVQHVPVAAPVDNVEPASKPVVPAPRVWTSAPANHVIRRLNSRLDLPPRPPPGTSRTFRDPQIDSVYPISDDIVLDQQQRKSYYDTLSRVLGPATGIQECVGSYKAYMEKQLQVYYEPILSWNLEASPPHAGLVSGNLGRQMGIATDEASSIADLLALPCVKSILQDYVASSILVDIDNSCSSDEVTCKATEHPSVATKLLLNSDNIFDSSLVVVEQSTTLVQRTQPRTISFSSDGRALLDTSTCFFSATRRPYFDSSSSSLAGALGEPLPLVTLGTDQDSKRKSKEWTRPRMGRARAYSAGGGM